MGVSGTPDQDYDTTYTYYNVGRPNRVVGPGLDGTYGAAYSRLTDSELVEYARFKSSSDVDLATIQRKPLSSRDLLSYVENQAGTSTVSKYDYTLDTLGRRTFVAMTGAAFSGGSGEHHWDFLYNGRSELTDRNRRSGTAPDQGTSFSPNGVFDYVSDPIGNRASTVVDTTTRNYCRNNVNQYPCSDKSGPGGRTTDGKCLLGQDKTRRVI